MSVCALDENLYELLLRASKHDVDPSFQLHVVYLLLFYNIISVLNDVTSGLPFFQQMDKLWQMNSETIKLSV